MPLLIRQAHFFLFFHFLNFAFPMNFSTFYCPEPLLTFIPSQIPDYTTTLVAYQNCAVPCPSLDLNSTEWSNLQNLILYLVMISFFLSSSSFLAHIMEFRRFYIRIMFIGGFLFNSTVIGSFMLLNRDSGIVCSGVHYIEKSSWCIFQASATIFLFIWTETWSAILAYDTYQHICSEMKYHNTDQLRTIYTVVASVISTIFTAIPLALGNLGFDPKANIPICLYLVSGNSTVFWTCFVAPFYFLLLVSLYYTVRCALRIHAIFISSNHYIRDNTVGSDKDFKALYDSSNVVVSDSNLGGTSSGAEGGGPGSPEYASERSNGDVLGGLEQHSNRYGFSFSFGSTLDSRDLRKTLVDAMYGGEDYIDGIEHDEWKEYTDLGEGATPSSFPAQYHPPVLLNSPLQQPTAFCEEGEGGSFHHIIDATQGHHDSGRNTDSVLQVVIQDRNGGEVGVNGGVGGSNRTGTATGTGGSWLYSQLLAAVWRYNGRSILFVLVFCLTTLSLLPLTIDVYSVNFAKCDNSADEFVTCLVLSSLESPVQSQVCLCQLCIRDLHFPCFPPSFQPSFLPCLPPTLSHITISSIRLYS